MTSQGSPVARFRRALNTRNPTLVRAAAAEIPHVSLDDALAACLVVGAREPDLYPRWAARWLGRYAVEAGACDLDELHLLLAALRQIPEPAHRQLGLDTLAALAEARGQTALVAVVDWWCAGDASYEPQVS